MAHPDFADDPSLCQTVLGANSEPIHRRARVRGIASVGRGVLREYAVECGVQGHALDAERRQRDPHAVRENRLRGRKQRGRFEGLTG
jgi:hypothetical protein